MPIAEQTSHEEKKHAGGRRRRLQGGRSKARTLVIGLGIVALLSGDDCVSCGRWFRGSIAQILASSRNFDRTIFPSRTCASLVKTKLGHASRV